MIEDHPMPEKPAAKPVEETAAVRCCRVCGERIPSTPEGFEYRSWLWLHYRCFAASGLPAMRLTPEQWRRVREARDNRAEDDL